jgi:tRNA U34 2-thiouridine synthase MnmA/TrmU
MKHKAIALLSGGLDSTLAVRLILDQGIEVEALNFVTPFCTCNRQGWLWPSSTAKTTTPARQVGAASRILALLVA